MIAITLRKIPPEIQKAIKAKAKQKNISINRAVLELLRERLGSTDRRTAVLHHDLDDLAGAWSPAEKKGFDSNLAVQRGIDEDLW